MPDIIQQNKWLCWQTSGWNEAMKQRKKKRKRCRILQSITEEATTLSRKCQDRLNLNPPMPRMKSLAPLFAPLLFSLLLPHFILNNQQPMSASCQLIVEHPRSRMTNRWPMFRSGRAALLPSNGSDFSGARQSDISRLELDIFNAASVSNYSMLPTSSEEREEFVRKLSSTTLLQTLLKRPLPLNKLPLPALPLSILTDQIRTELDQRRGDVMPNKNRLAFKGTASLSRPASATALDVSTTNITSVLDGTSEQVTSQLLNDSISTKPTSFKAAPLNFLVERLLRGEHFKDEDKFIRKRPTSRQKSPSSDSVSKNHYPPHPLPPNPMTLDMLIKDEYDSRVEPMLKSLLIQQQLSTQKTAKSNSDLTNQTEASTGLINHRLDAQDISNFTIRSLIGEDSDENTTSPTYNATTTPISSGSESVVSLSPNQNELVSFEDSDDTEDEEETEDDGEEVPGNHLFHAPHGNNNSNAFPTRVLAERSSTRKPLNNVPPYQYSHNFGITANTSKMAKPKELQVTTSSSSNSVTSGSDYDGRNHLPNQGEKAAAATTRGSLVFSDGGDEGERGNKRKEPRVKADSTKTSKRRKDNLHTVGSVRSQQNGKPSDGMLLQQLFSTINPIADFEHRFKEPSRDLDFKTPDPLIYKGYVGKDDYLLSSTARDWSRPLNNRSNIPIDMFRYSYNGMSTTTQAPHTEPSVVTYNPFTSQPVTNGQAVPTMVIPTSDSSDPTTTLPPMSFDQGKRRYAVQRSQVVPSQEGPPQVHSASINKPFLPRAPILYSTTNRSSSSDRKYSYQIPNSQNETQNQVHRNHSVVNVNSTRSYLNEPPEGDFGNTASSSKYPVSEELEHNWSPTKLISGESSQTNQRRRPQVQHGNNNAMIITGGRPLNSSKPVLVSITGTNPSPMIVTMNMTNRPVSSSFQPLPDVSEGDMVQPIVTTTDAPMIATISETSGRKENAPKVARKDTSRTNSDKRSSIQRDKSKIPAPTLTAQESSTQGGNELSIGDANADQELKDTEESSEGNGRRIKRPSGNRREKPEKADADLGDDYLGETDGDAEDHAAVYRQKSNNKKQSKEHQSNSPTRLDKTHTTEESHQKQNQVVRGTIKHDAAESEITVTGLDKNLQLAGGRPHNRTTVRNSPRLPVRTNGTLSTTGNDARFPPATSVESSISTSSGSAIIPNSNFVSEASSESPILENSIINLNNNAMDGKITQLQGNDDSQRLNSILNLQSSTASTPAGNSLVPTTTPRTLSTSAIVPQVNSKQDESSLSINARESTKPSAKSSNDRLAFILIGGSCALSVVCLVLAAMSMRCQDMCDDYRSLRNAERAALKLQKHRLKYTKNHQINSFNPNRTSYDAAHTLLDNISGPTNMTSNSTGPTTDINQSSNIKCLNNNRFIQFTDPHPKNNNHSNDQQSNMWTAPNCQLPVSAMVNRELHSCKCSNCLHQRGWIHSDDVMAGNKHLSWLHPYYYMQHQARLKPLFGAGSSVGTFFPRRLDDQTFDNNRGGSTDAQILIDNQPPHKCSNVVEPRGVARSKSILLKSKRNQKHAPGLSMSRDVHNSTCNNPDHSHSRHVCHSHAANHLHRYNMETSTSEESEMTIDDSVLCDSVKCSANHQSFAHLGRHKLSQLKPSHNHHSSVWKPHSGSVRKASLSHNHAHHHHHHHHQPVSSSDGGSIAPCTCARDSQPLLSSSHRLHNPHRTSHKHLSKQELRASLQAQARRDKSMLIWSTNRDRLI